MTDSMKEREKAALAGRTGETDDDEDDWKADGSYTMCIA
jgi:hypothetical protein